MLYPSKTQSASQVPAQSASLAQFSTKTHYTPGLCSQLTLFLPPRSACILHDSLVILNKPNNSPTTLSSDGRLRLVSPCDRDIIHLLRGGWGCRFSPAPPKQSRSREGEGGAVLRRAPGSFLCLPAPAWDWCYFQFQGSAMANWPLPLHAICLNNVGWTLCRET